MYVGHYHGSDLLLTSVFSTLFNIEISANKNLNKEKFTNAGDILIRIATLTINYLMILYFKFRGEQINGLKENRKRTKAARE